MTDKQSALDHRFLWVFSAMVIIGGHYWTMIIYIMVYFPGYLY